MPPKRKNNVPSGTPKGRRPKVAGTGGRTIGRNDPRNVEAKQADPETVKADETEAVAAPAAKPEPSESESTESKSKAVPSADAEKAGADTEKSGTEKTDTEKPAAEKASDRSAAPKTRVANKLPRLGARSQDKSAETTEAPKGKGAGTSRVTWKLVAILAAVAVVLAVFAAVAAYKPFARFDNMAWIDTATTAEVTAAATEAAEATFSYGFETVDKDFERARTFMNDQMREEFDQTAETTKTAVQQTKTATKADIRDIGVRMLHDGHAELVAFMNVSSTNQGAAQGSTSGSLVIDMERVDGKWVLAGIRDA